MEYVIYRFVIEETYEVWDSYYGESMPTHNTICDTLCSSKEYAIETCKSTFERASLNLRSEIVASVYEITVGDEDSTSERIYRGYKEFEEFDSEKEDYYDPRLKSGNLVEKQKEEMASKSISDD